MDALHECTAPLQSNPPNFRLPDPGAVQTPVSEISTSLRALQAAGIVVETSERRRGRVYAYESCAGMLNAELD